MSDPTYALGRSDDEHARLTEQANFLRRLTERFFRKAGIAPGMDRYMVWPGQADSYEVGEHEILALRDRARTELGVRFDIRKFHNAVIDHGSVPLPVLDQVIAAWIDAQRSGSAG